jgi:hypothetical protein
MAAAWSCLKAACPGALPRRRPPASPGILRFRPRFELVEDRTLLSTFLVMSTADSGPGSLRQAILDSNASTGQTNTIVFAIPGSGVQTISPLSALPAITQAVLIDGESQTGYPGTPLIELSGSQAGSVDGLTITGSDVTVRGLDINGFSQGAGILISGTNAFGNVIAANDIGTDHSGAQALPNYFGVRILDGAHDNLVGGATPASGNLIANNLGPGAAVEGDGSVGNQITADRIFANDASPTPTPTGMLQLDGSSFVRLPQNLVNYPTPNSRPLNGRTFEAWFQTTSGGVILGSQNSDPSSTRTFGLPVLYVGSDGKLYASPFSSDSVVNDGRWHYVALANGRLYLDGRLIGSGSGFVPYGASFDQIGTGYTNPNDPSTPGGWYFFRGQIADMRVWSMVRSADQIDQDMTTAQAGTDSNLDAYYPLDDGQGLTAHDLSPHHDDATLAGIDGHLPTWSSSGGVAIDLGDDGVTANSPAPRQGANDLQNFPTIVATAGGRLEGWLGGSEPDTTYRIDVFASAGSGAGGAGEAQDFLGSLEVTTDNQGQAVFDVPFSPPAGLPLVTATATDPGGNTSEVADVRTASLEAPAQPVRVVPGRPLILSSTPGEGIAIQDPAAWPLDPAWDLTLSVTAGLLTLSRTAGLVGTGNGTGTLHYEGSLTALNAALEGLRFTPPPDFHGNTVLSLDAESAGTTPLQAHVLISDGRFLVTATTDSGPGSLRQALLDSNAATGGTNTIDFNISGSGVQTIAPASPLPAITNPVLIDGTSQPRYAGKPLIAIVAASPRMADGLTIAGSAVTVRGLANSGFVLGTGNPLDNLTVQSGLLQAGGAGLVETYRIDTSSDGRLVVRVDSLGITTRLTLLDAQGQVLVESDGLSTANPDGRIDQHLAAGTYFLRTESAGSGDLVLAATFTPASAPFQPIPVGSQNYLNLGYDPLAVGDFNGDGIPDMVAMDGVHLGLRDGTFQEPSVGLGLSAANPNLDGMVIGDFNGDGELDLAVAFTYSSDIAVLLGNGDGTFQAPQFYAVGSGFITDPGVPGTGSILVAGNFNGDGHLDLAVANPGSNDVSVLLGNGDGTFRPAVEYPVGKGPEALVAGDFTGDGHLDLAVADSGSNDIAVLLGNGDGTLRPAVRCAVASSPDAIVAGDFTRDGHLDLAVSDAAGIELLLGNGDGTFQAPQTITGVSPTALVVGDFRGDGKLDLAAAAFGSSDVYLLLGNGDGTFQTPQAYSVGNQPGYDLGFAPYSLVAADFTGDGRLDLATADFHTDQMSVLVNNGDGTFQIKENFATGEAPYAVIAADFTGNGRLDLATPNILSNDVSVLLGNGDGTFQPQATLAAGITPAAIAAGDFNDDGRLDLAVAGYDPSTLVGEVAVLLGNGDGTFQSPVTYDVGFLPPAIVAGDFTGDGRLDLAVAGWDPSTGAGEVAVLLGNGDGTFQPAIQYPVGWNLDAIVAGDFAGDGRLDLAVAGFDSSTFAGDVSVLLGKGDGTFQPAKSYAVGSYPYSLVAGDFTGSGRTDLAVADSGGPDDVSVLLANGVGTFQPAVQYPMSLIPSYIVAGDFTGDRKLDLAVTGTDPVTGAGEVWVLPGNGDGTFQSAHTVASVIFGSLIVGDFTGDGRTDLAVADQDTNTVSVLLSNGDGTFTAPGQFVTTPHATPLVADVNGDGTDDVLVVDGHGNILYRQGVPGQPGAFEPPVTINPGLPSRDIAWVPDTNQGPLLASADAHDDAVSLYAWRNGAFIRLGSLPTGRLPAQIIAANLNGDGLTDLVVRNAGDGTLTVFFGSQFIRGNFIGPLNPQLVPPSFLPPVTLPVGIGVSDVQAVDTAGSGKFDLVVTNKLTGQVSVLHNLRGGAFAPPAPYRAGTGLSAVDLSSSPEVTSLEATADVAAGPLTPGGPTSLVTINPGSSTMDILAGLGQGRFANPVAIGTPSPAQIIRTADFTGSGAQDLAVLTAKGVSIFLGNAKGGFALPVTYDVPPESDGLTIADVTGNGKLDLLVGDAYGDVLVLLGNGDGTFRPYRGADQSVALAVADLTGNGSKDVIYADQGLDRVVVDYGAGGTTVLGDQASGLLSPGAVKLADLNGDGIPDLIVANSGSNNVLIYPGLGNGQFGPAVNDGHGFFVGTNPVGVTVANLTGKLPDLVVADKGSNRVSILLNKSQGGTISFDQGPRLNSGGSGPVSTVVGHFTGSPNQDILVTNSGSNNVALLPGVGGGFFNDTNPQTFAVGNNPGPIFAGTFDGKPDVVTVNAGSNDLTLISDFMRADAVTRTISSGGTDPVTAFSFSGGSGFDDLVVGNGGDGVLALFEGGDQGLTLTSSATNPDLPSPSAVVYAGLASGDVQFYAATEGREAAALVALSLGGETALPAPLPSPSPLTPVVAQLVPLQESSVALVGTLLITTLPSSSNEVILARAETEVAATVSQTSSAPVAPNQTVLVEILSDETGGGGEPPAPPLAARAQAEAPAGSWQRHVLGTDEAIEQFDRDHPDLSQPRREEPPQSNPTQGQAHPAEGDRLDAIDQAIEEVTDCRVGETHQEFNHITTQTVGFTHPTMLQAIEDLSDPCVGETIRKFNHITSQLVGFTHSTGLEAIDGMSDRRVGETHQEFNHIKIQTVGCTHRTAAALALAATVAGEFYFGSWNRRGRERRRFAGLVDRRDLRREWLSCPPRSC